MRAALIVPPGGSLAAASASGADALIFELGGETPPPGLRLYPRIAPLDDPRSQTDLAAAVALRPAGIALPLARGAADVQRLGARLAVLEAEAGLPDGSIRILAFATETPEALFQLASYRGASARLEALIYTFDPLAAALGLAPERLRRAPAPGALRWAREMTLVAARAAGVLALDAPSLDPGDSSRLRAEATAARDDGFDGKLARTAAEVAAIRTAYK
jgi:citrate lyase subunit beta/citryl-CoA lyase